MRLQDKIFFGLIRADKRETEVRLGKVGGGREL